MKKLIATVSVLMGLWLMMSMIDITADNTQPNPTHSKYNLITIGCEMFSKRTVEATVSQSNVKDYGYIEATDVNGDVWALEVSDTDEIPLGTKCKIKLDTQGTTKEWDDEVIDIQF